MAILRTPAGGTVKIIERGNATAAVFLHSCVGSAGEWRRCSCGGRGVPADRGGRVPRRRRPRANRERTLDDYADQVHAAENPVGEPGHLIGFSLGGATGLHVMVTMPEVLASLTVVSPWPPRCSGRNTHRPLPRSPNCATAGVSTSVPIAGTGLRGVRGRLQRTGLVARWPTDRREVFLDDQRARGDLGTCSSMRR